MIPDGFHPLWWHWLALGLALVGAEMVVPSFTIVWFGLAACAVGLLLLAAPGLSLAAQLLVWAVASAGCTWLWFSVFRPRMVDRTKSGMAREAIVGESGMVLRGVATPMDRGRIRFAVPLLGAEEWEFISPEPLRPGDYARVTGIEGHVLRVERNPAA